MNVVFDDEKPMKVGFFVSVDAKAATPRQLRELVGPLNNLNLQRVQSWGQRVEPKPGTLIYSNGPDPVTPSNHDWRSTPISAQDDVGLYLGGNIVAVARHDMAN